MFVDRIIVENKEVSTMILTPVAQRFVEIEQVRLLNEIRRRLDVIRTFPWLDYIKKPEEFIKDLQSLLSFAKTLSLDF